MSDSDSGDDNGGFRLGTLGSLDSYYEQDATDRYDGYDEYDHKFYPEEEGHSDGCGDPSDSSPAGDAYGDHASGHTSDEDETTSEEDEGRNYSDGDQDLDDQWLGDERSMGGEVLAGSNGDMDDFTAYHNGLIDSDGEPTNCALDSEGETLGWPSASNGDDCNDDCSDEHQGSSSDDYSDEGYYDYSDDYSGEPQQQPETRAANRSDGPSRLFASDVPATIQASTDLHGWEYDHNSRDTHAHRWTKEDQAITHWPSTKCTRTAMNHPRRGPTQAFSRNPDDLEKVIQNIRAHTNNRYYTTDPRKTSAYLQQAASNLKSKRVSH